MLYGKVLVQEDCNRCDVRSSCNGMIRPQNACSRYVYPTGHNKFVEVAALEHPTSFNQAMSNLPDGIDFKLKYFEKFM